MPYNSDTKVLSFIVLFHFVVNQPSPPVHPAFFTINSGNHIRIESRDSSFSDNAMDGGSGEPINDQVLFYGFIIKLFTPNTNTTSYCPLVSIT